MKRLLLGTSMLAGVALSAQPAAAFDITLSDNAYLLVETNLWVSATAGGDDEGVFARGAIRGLLNYTVSSGLQLGVTATLEGRSDQDDDIDNLGDGPDGSFYAGYVYATGRFGDVVVGKTFGAVTELVDIAPSAISLNYSVHTPFFIHIERPRFAPRSATVSPDFIERTERIAFYSPDLQGFRIGMSYAPELQDDGAETLTNIHSEDAIDIALVWTGMVNDVRVRLSGGYEQATANVVAANTTTAADQTHWTGGARFDWHGWQLSGGVQYTDNTLGLRNIDNISYQGGVMYTWDAFAISGAYGYTEDQYSRDLVANPILGGVGDASAEFLELSGRYQYSPHVAISAAAISVDYQDNVILPNVSNDGAYGVLQLHLSY